MTFEEVVDQALAMLQRRGRVTYRLLKRQFDLDDEALEDLKLELIKGQRLAMDEEGEVLVWTGAEGTVPESNVPPPSPQQRPTQDIHHAAALPSPPNSPPSEAERRQLTVLAEVCGYRGHLDDGLQALAEAHTLVEQHEERFWEAEVYRLRGVLLLRQLGTPQAEAEIWLQRALDVARRQEAKSLELRAAMSLAHLWQQQSKRAAARDLLAPIYGWFTEGSDTADLQEAKALLEELG